QKNPQAAQLAAQFGPLAQVLTHIAAQPAMPPGAQPQDPGAQMQGAAAAMAQGQAGAAANGNQDNPAAVANALANLMRAGAHVDVQDVNAALAAMGLPPLAKNVMPPKDPNK